MIVGGKNSAAEAAIRLERVGAKVTLCHRRPALVKERIKPWVYPELISLIRRKEICYLGGVTPVAIRPSEVTLQGCKEDGSVDPEGPTSVCPTDNVLLLTGYRQDATLYEQAGITLEGEGKKPTYDPQTMETNQRGLYVAGTGAAGTQIGGVTEFIETSHIHVKRILAHLQGEPAPTEQVTAESLREM